MSFDYTEVRKAEAELRSVLAVLERNGAGYTEVLRGLLADMGSNNRFVAKEAFFKAVDLCHPKCLGDQYLKDIRSEEWFAMLGKLEEACAAAFKCLEKA